MAGLGYLYLFYSDFEAENMDPVTMFNNSKQRIKDFAIQRLQTEQASSAQVEQTFEYLYGIKPDAFGNIDIMPDYQPVNTALSSLDDAIDEYQRLSKDGGTVKQWSDMSKNLTKQIDNVLQIGADAGGFNTGAYNQVKEALDRFQKNILPHLKYQRTIQSHHDDIVASVADVVKNVSGYAWELTFPVAFIGASEKGLEAIHGTMMDIGSQTVSGWVTKTSKNDPNVQNDLNKVQQMVNSNMGTQAKADNLVSIHVADGNGVVQATPTWVGFQLKNYKNIKNVHIASKTLEELNLFNWYDRNTLINVVGGLGNNYRQAKIPITMARHGIGTKGQGELDEIWNSVKNSMKLLCAADAIAGEMNANFTNKVNYYVIRNKDSGDAIVIGVSRIIQKIRDALENNENSSLGINWGNNENRGHKGSRDLFWHSNVGSFQTEHTPQAKYIRSGAAYRLIMYQLLWTRISISINFSSFFAK